MDKIKLAVIGTGSISHEHIKAYKKNENVDLYALCDINEERVIAAGEKYGVKKVYADVEEMLRELPEIDAVSVCTWNSAHAPCAIAALNAGKHVLCEKPMAISQEEALEMKKAADTSGKLLMIGFVRRFGNDCSILKDYISQNYFGDIYYAKASCLRRDGNPGGWFGDKARSGGGPLIDLGVHIIDLVRYLMGNVMPVSVYGTTFSKLGNRPNIKNKSGWMSADRTEEDSCDVEDLATAIIRFDNGAALSIDTSFSLNIKKDELVIQLFGTKAGAKIDPEIEIYTEINNYLTDVKIATDTALNFDGLFEREVNHFVDCIINGTECINPAQDGVVLMRILDAIYESARTGHEIILK